MLGIEILLVVGCFIQVTCGGPPPIKMQLPSGLLGVKDGEAIDIVDARLDKLNGTVCELGERMKALQVDTQQAIGTVAQTEASTTQLKTSHDELENEVVELSATVTTIQREVLKLKELNAGIQNKQGDLERKTDQAIEDLSVLNQVATQVADIEKGLREEREKNKFIENSMTQLQATVTALTTEDKCPTSNGYISVQTPRLCFKLSDASDTRTRSDAQSQCQSDGGRLIILNTEERHDVTLTYMEKKGTHSAFVGMEKVNYVFKWNDGSDYVRKWDDNEPDFLSYQNCVALWKDGLGDIECGSQRPYICEVPLAE